MTNGVNKSRERGKAGGLLHSEKMASIGQLANGIAMRSITRLFVGNNLSVFDQYVRQLAGAFKKNQDLRQAVETEQGSRNPTPDGDIQSQEKTTDIPLVLKDTEAL